MAPSLGHSQSLLPNPAFLILDRIEQDPSNFRLFVHADQEPACPVCGYRSRPLHSIYCRHRQDLPSQGMAVRVWLSVGRFRCQNKRCTRKISCERRPGVTRAYGRQTDRAAEIVRLVGYIVGGRPGQRLLMRPSISTSDDRVFRRTRQTPLQPSAALPAPHFGVDDWVWKKHQNYGAFVVNLDMHRAVDLLPDRNANSFSSWLQQHHEVAVISRDRCGLSAEGAILGAPQAKQVADRFHLVMNLSSAVERVSEGHRQQMVLLATREEDPAPEILTAISESEVLPNPKASDLCRQRRLALYEQMVDLSQAGLSKSAIARQLKLSGNTVLRWLRREHFPDRRPRNGIPPRVSEFPDYLSLRWNEGCHNAIVLHREVREKGFGGTYWGVARLLPKWRKTGTANPDVPRRIAPSQAAILMTRWSNELNGEQQQLLDRLTAHCPRLSTLRTIALDCRRALKSRDSRLLRHWIARAPQAGFEPIAPFATILKKDMAAVTAAVKTDWSNGQTEGQINRIKTVKRQMYGRADFALLRGRVLPYCPAYTAAGSSR